MAIKGAEPIFQIEVPFPGFKLDSHPTGLEKLFILFLLVLRADRGICIVIFLQVVVIICFQFQKRGDLIIPPDAAYGTDRFEITVFVIEKSGLVAPGIYGKTSRLFQGEEKGAIVFVDIGEIQFKRGIPPEKTLKVEILQDETGIYIESLLGGGFFTAIVKEGITQADLTGEIQLVLSWGQDRQHQTQAEHKNIYT